MRARFPARLPRLHSNAPNRGLGHVSAAYNGVMNPPASPASIWVDADSCPNVVKDILFRAAERSGIQLTLVANKPTRIPRAPNVRFIQVDGGFDAADKRIVELMQGGDLVITADLPLAALVIEGQGTALNPRGELYTLENVREKLSLRNFTEELRGGGLVSGGPPALDQRDRQRFANALDRWLARRAAAQAAALRYSESGGSQTSGR
jgi:uncharacterized protein YaiI (UPF0178 family)